MKKWGILLIILTIISIIFGFFLLRIMNSPQYSLKQLEKAMDKQDVVAFNKYLDLDAVVDNFIDDTWQYYTSNGETGDKWNDIRNEIGNSLLSVVKPGLKEIIKEEVIDYIATGEWISNKSKSDNGISSIIINIFKDRINPDAWDKKTINYSKVEDNIAYVGLTYYDKKIDSNFLIEIKLRNMKGYWQVIEIVNIPKILNMYQNINE